MLRDIGFVCPIRIHQPISRLKNGGRRSGETHQRATSSPLPPNAPLSPPLPFWLCSYKNVKPPKSATSTPRNILHSQQMPTKSTGRRGFLKTVALAGVPLAPADAQTPAQTTPAPHPPKPVILPRSSMRYPRIYTGRQLAMLAMPLGGIAAGSISLGGRGQLRDWELFN